MLQAVPSSGNERPLCAFPGCKRLVVERTGRPGRPSEFCADTDHNYSRAYDERRKLVRAAAKAEADAERDQPRPQMTPVSSGIEALGELITQLPELEQRYAAAVSDAHDLLAGIADPRSLATEVAYERAEANRLVAEAQAAQARAEHQAAQLQFERDAAVEAQRLAEGAADEAITARDQAIERVNEIAATLEQRIADAIELRDAQLTALMDELDNTRRRADRAEADRDTAIGSARVAQTKADKLQTQLDEVRRKATERIETVLSRQSDVLARALESAVAFESRVHQPDAPPSQSGRGRPAPKTQVQERTS